MTDRTPDPMPFLDAPGDMGEFEKVQVTITADGEPVYARKQTGPAIYTGGRNADGTPTLAWHGWNRSVAP